MMKGETTALCSKTRVTFANNSNLQKQEQNSQYFEIKLDTQNFLTTFVNHLYTATAKSSSRLG